MVKDLASAVVGELHVRLLSVDGSSSLKQMVSITCLDKQIESRLAMLRPVVPVGCWAWEFFCPGGV